MTNIRFKDGDGNLKELKATGTGTTLDPFIQMPAVTIADGSDVATGGVADSAASAGGTGTVSAKLRRLSTDINTLLGQLPSSLSGSGNLKTVISEALPAGSNNIGTVVVYASKTLDYDTSGATDTVTGLGILLPSATGAVAGGTSTNPLRVDVTGSTTQPVSGTVSAAQSGTWTVQPGNTANTTPWLFSIHDGTNKASVRDCGSNDALNVSIVDASGNQITSFGGSTQYTEDGASAGGESLTLAGAVRADSPSSSTSADGDYANLKTDSVGRLWVNASGAAVPITDNSGSITVDGTVAATQSGTWNITTVTNVVHVDDNSSSLTVDNGGTFVVQENGAALTSLQLIDDIVHSGDATLSKYAVIGAVFDDSSTATVTENNASSLRMSSRRALLVEGVASGTALNVTVSSALPAGTAAIGKLAANDGVDIGDVTINNTSIAVTDNSGSLTVDNGGTFATQDSQVITDNAGFTDGTSKLFISGFIYDEVAGTALTENDAAAGRINVNRAIVNTIEDGSTRGRYATVTSSNALKVDNSGVTQPVSGTITANIGTAGSLALDASVTGLQLTQGSTTSGQKGELVFGAVTTSAPSYTTTQSNPISLTTSGLLRVDNSGVTQPVSGTVTVQQSTASNLKVDLSGTSANSTAIKVDPSAVTSPVKTEVQLDYDTSGATQSLSVIGLGLPSSTGVVAGGTSTNPIITQDKASGSVTGGTAGSNSLLIGGQYVSSAPTLTNTQQASLQLDANGNLKVNIITGAGSGGTASTDDSAFTVGSTNYTPIGGTYKSTLDTVDDNDGGAVHMTQYRAMHVNIRDNSGNEVSIGGGTQYDEDTASSPADKITMAGVVRSDTAASLVGTDGDRTQLIVDSTGKLHVNVGNTVTVASHAVTNAGTFATQAAQSGTWNITNISGTVSLPTGAATLAEQQTQTTSLQLIDDIVHSGDATLSKYAVIGACFDDASVGTVTEDNARSLRMSSRRALYVETPSSGTFAVTASAGTNLNTSALALESGGNLATIAGAVRAEDAASADAHTGIGALAVRKATPANTSGTDGDYEFLQISAGRLWTSTTVDTALPAGTNAIGKLAANTGVTIGAVEIAASQTLATVTTITNVVHVDDNSSSLTVDNGGTFAVQDSQVIADNAGFTDGTSKLFMSGYIYDETAGTSLTENDAAAARINANRAVVGIIEDGSTRGRYATVTSANALSSNIAQLAGTTTDTNSGSKSAGTLRVVIATDQPALTNSLSVTVASSTDTVSTFDHGSKSSISTSAVQILASSVTATKGVLVKAAAANSGKVYVGNSDVTNGSTDATDGFELSASESVLVPVDNVNKIYVIGSAASQKVFWMIA